MKTLALLVPAAALAGLAYTTPAHALGPVDIEIAARVGGATSPDPNLPVNPLGFGAGGRAGVSVFGFYGGISGIYYVGGSKDGGSLHSALEGFEAGYTIKIPFVRIRPQVGVGNFTLASNADTGSISNLYVEPGVLVFVPIGFFFVGADVNALILPGISSTAGGNTTDVSLSAHGQVGVRF